MAQIAPKLGDLVELFRAEADAKLEGVDVRLERDLVDVLVLTQAAGLHLAYGYIQRIADDLFPDTAEDEALDRLASLYDISRGAATFAQGWVGSSEPISGVIPSGTVLRRADGREYVRVDEGILPDGTVVDSGGGDFIYSEALIGLGGAGWIFPVRAVESGSDGNTPADSEVTFVEPLSGVPPIATVRLGLTGAVDQESDDSLRAELLARWKNPPQGGTAAEYKAWALGASTDDDPISRAFVVPPAAGSNVVTVYVVDDGGGIPSANPPTPTAQAITNVEAAIDARRPISAARAVSAPTFVAITPTIALSPDTAAIRTAIENEIDAFLIDNVEPGLELPVSILQAVVATAAGGGDAQITAPTSNWTPAPGELLYRGAITWV